MSLIEFRGYTMNYYLPVETKMSTEKIRLVEEFFKKKELYVHFDFELMGSYGIKGRIKSFLGIESEYAYLFKISVVDGHDGLANSLGSLDVEKDAREYIGNVFKSKVASYVSSKVPALPGEKSWERINGDYNIPALVNKGIYFI